MNVTVVFMLGKVTHCVKMDQTALQNLVVDILVLHITVGPMHKRCN